MSLLVELDGNDVTNLAVSGSWTRRLNRPMTAQITIPMQESILGTGAKLKITNDSVMVFHGHVLLCETEGSEDQGTTVYNATDPFHLWEWRPVRDADGDYTKPTIIADFQTGPQIIEEAISNSISATAASDPYPDGDLLIDANSFAMGGIDLSGAPVDWPMTMSELMTLLCSTGQLDVILTPIDSAGNMAQLDAYNGDYGTDQSPYIAFQYGTGQFNVRSFRWNEDASKVLSKLRYLLGPRVLSSTDPAGDQHWRSSVDTGGASVPDLCDYLTRFSDMETTYGGRFDIRIFDGDAIASVKELYLRLFALEACLRGAPQTIVHVTPIRGAVELGQFDIGDLVLVEIVSSIRGGISGVQRVYEYTVSWDTDSVLSLSEIGTSTDQEF